MRNTKVIVPLIGLTLLLASCNTHSSESTPPGTNGEEIVLPEVFYNRNFCVVSGNWNENGCALIIDNSGNVEIQNVSSHNEFYDIEFDLLPIYTKVDNEKTTYFLPFFVKGQIIDDGYFKNGNQYRFYLRFDDPSYYCAVSANDPSIVNPDKVLMEGYM